MFDICNISRCLNVRLFKAPEQKLQKNTILEISYIYCQKYNTYNYIFNIHSISQA